MDALILLLISVCLLSSYGFIFVSVRLYRMKQERQNQYRKSFVVFLCLIIISGSSATMLILS
ncbi:hypothetical protein GN156_12130 [bacterium LRH843]|nr:hypothetical protein [bacterium LRH843]